MNEIMLSVSSDCLWALDANYRSIYANGAVERVLGYSPDELQGFATFAAIVHEDDRARLAALFERSAATRTGWSGEILRVHAKDGSLRWLESNGSATFDEHGNFTGFAGADRDITERVAHESRLAEAERRFRATFEHAGAGIARVSVETGAWLEVNQQLCETLGYTAEELVQRTFRDLTHPDDLAADEAQLVRLIAGEITSYSLEKRYLRQDGTYVWSSLTASIVADENGTPEYGIAVIKDITARREAETALRQSEQDYRTMFESSHDPVLIIDPETLCVLAANRKACEAYGYAATEFEGMSMQRIMKSEQRGRAAVGQLFAGARSVDFECVHFRHDGEEIEFELTVALVQYRGRTAVLSTNRDVTERNRLVRALAASERRFRALVEHGFDVMTILDRRGVIRFMSGTVSQELGYSPEELLETSILDRIAEADRERVQAIFAEVSAQPEARATIRCHVRNQRGEWRDCEGTIVNMVHVDGVEGLVVTVRDVTERTTLETQLEQTRRVESLGRVAATVAHEFNNSLMAIAPIADHLSRKHAANPDLQRVAQQLNAGLQRGRRVANGILRFANPSQPARSRVELHTWLATVTAEMRPLLANNVLLTTRVDPALAVDVDPEQLHQMLMNLVLNARDAMTGGGTITVSAARTGEWVDLAVSDTGPGIPQEVRARLFEPLFTTKRNGTGLGLPLVQQIVTANGGTVSVEDNTPSGARFRMRFPAAADVQPARPRMLLVEDDPFIAQALMIALEELYDVTWMNRAEGVVERARELRPQLVLLDVQLPDGDGRDVHAQVRRAAIDVPVVLMSGSAMITPTQLDARSAFLPKPFEIEELLSVTTSLNRVA